jgi:hypothetical protein
LPKPTVNRHAIRVVLITKFAIEWITRNRGDQVSPRSDQRKAGDLITGERMWEAIKARMISPGVIARGGTQDRFASEPTMTLVNWSSCHANGIGGAI